MDWGHVARIIFSHAGTGREGGVGRAVANEI
jgi:hypothetical protein